MTNGGKIDALSFNETCKQGVKGQSTGLAKIIAALNVTASKSMFLDSDSID